MTLPISSTIIRNALGYLQIELSGLYNYLNTLDSNTSTLQEKADAEVKIIQFAKNIGKLVKTLEERTSWVMPVNGYTNQQLTDRGIL